MTQSFTNINYRMSDIILDDNYEPLLLSPRVIAGRIGFIIVLQCSNSSRDKDTILVLISIVYYVISIDKNITHLAQ